MKDLLWQVIVICFMTASLTVFLRFCMGSGNIFGWYGDWIDKQWDESPNMQPLLKVIGACNKCYGTWVFIVLFCCYWLFSNQKDGVTSMALCTILGCGVNYMFINLFEKITD